MKLVDLQVSDLNARQTHTEEEVKDLEGSIDKYGMISKIILRKKEDSFEVIAGGRRLMALRLIHGDEYDLPESDYIIMDDLSDEEALILSIQENQQRSALSPYDMAKSIYKLKSEFKTKESEILRIFNITSYRYKRLLHLVEDWGVIKEPKIKEELQKPESTFTDAHWERMRGVEKPEVVKDVFDWVMDKQCPPADLPLVIKGIEHNHKKEDEAQDSSDSSSREKPKSYTREDSVVPALEGPIEYEHKGELTLTGKGKKRIFTVTDERESVDVPVDHYLEFLKFPENFKCYVSFKLSVKPIE